MTNKKIKSILSIKNEEQQLVTAPVLIPYYEDCDACRGEKQFTPEEIETFAHDYMANYRIADKQHEYSSTHEEVAIPVESYLLDEPKTFKGIEYPKGTWFLTQKVTCKDTWDKIKSGEYTGFSVTVTNKKVADNVMANKGRTLINDIENPTVLTVSIVDKPCVHDAVFCSVKDDSTKNNDDGLDVSLKAGRTISKQNKTVLNKIVEAVLDLLSKDEKHETRLEDDEMTNEQQKDENESEETTTKEYVTKSDLEDFKKEVLEAIKKEVPDKKKKQKPGQEKEEDMEEEEEEEDEKKKKKKTEKTNSGSKSIKNHDDKQEGKVSVKSLEEVTGRDYYGRKIR